MKKPALPLVTLFVMFVTITSIADAGVLRRVWADEFGAVW